MIDERVFDVGEEWVLLAKFNVAFCQLDIVNLTLDALCLVFIRVFWILVEGLFSVTVDSNLEDVSFLSRLALRFH